jgi:hypothetical protein
MSVSAAAPSRTSLAVLRALHPGVLPKISFTAPKLAGHEFAVACAAAAAEPTCAGAYAAQRQNHPLHIYLLAASRGHDIHRAFDLRRSCNQSADRRVLLPARAHTLPSLFHSDYCSLMMIQYFKLIPDSSSLLPLLIQRPCSTVCPPSLPPFMLRHVRRSFLRPLALPLPSQMAASLIGQCST